MVSISEARGVVAEMYPSYNWKRKVDKMPDYQVMAIYTKEMNKREKEQKAKDEQEDLGF